MRSRQILSVLFFTISAVGASAQTQQRWVVLPQTEARRLIGAQLLGLPDKIAGTWAPKQDDVSAMEANFHQVSVLSRKYQPGRQVENPIEYFRQYLGLLAGEKKRIYVSAFCGLNNNSLAPKYWRDHLFMISDGGSCVWQALYDVSAREFVGLSVNGFA